MHAGVEGFSDAARHDFEQGVLTFTTTVGIGDRDVRIVSIWLWSWVWAADLCLLRRPTWRTVVARTKLKAFCARLVNRRTLVCLRSRGQFCSAP